MSEEELTAALQEQGVDLSEVRSILVGSAGKQFSALFLRASKDLKRDAEFVENYIENYSSPWFEAIPESSSPLAEGLEKLTHFLNDKVRGKSLETLLMVCFVMYRQFSWFYLQYIGEQVKQFSPIEFNETELLLGLLGFESRTKAYVDFVVRGLFCSMRLYFDLQRCSERKEEFFLDPDAYILSIINSFKRAQLMFSNVSYWDCDISFIRRAVLSLALPLAWSGLFSRQCPGVPLQNTAMKRGLDSLLAGAAADGAVFFQKKYQSVFNEQAQKELFNKSGGILRERFFADAVAIGAAYAKTKYIKAEKVDGASFFARAFGQYAIEHLYLHGLIACLRSLCRRGAPSFIGKIGNGVGWLLEKMGIVSHSPVTAAGEKLAAEGKRLGLLEEGEPLLAILTYPAAFFPGAFVRAVKEVITRQKLAALAGDSAQLLKDLGAMQDVSLYDLFRSLALNPLAQHEMGARVQRVKAIVSAVDWQAILRAFGNELIVELFFDRQRLLCQVVTEPILLCLSRPILSALERELLPDKK